jgi:anti-sigma regulatory factor (Ser/Thr protein kinase)
LRELALHILDLIENALNAGATVVSVEISLQPEWDLMRVTLEDNGPGLGVPAEQAMDPFYTTKKGKKTGLGLSMFRFRIEQAGGEIALERSPLGGLAVLASMSLAHVDRNPLGDLASTLSSVVAANPQLELRCRLKMGEREQVIASSDVARELVVPDGRPLPSPTAGSFSIARHRSRKIKAGLEALQIKEY